MGAGVSFRLGEFRRWTAAAPSEAGFLRPRRLARCGDPVPRSCPLRASRELIAGTTQDDALEALIERLDGEIPERAKLRVFTYSGPMAVLREGAGRELLNPDSRSPLWDLIRSKARAGRVGLILLPAESQVLIPPVGLRRARARLEVTEKDNVVQPRFARFLREPDEDPDW